MEDTVQEKRVKNAIEPLSIEKMGIIIDQMKNIINYFLMEMRMHYLKMETIKVFMLKNMKYLKLNFKIKKFFQ